MDFALINATPFFITLILAFPAVRQRLTQNAITLSTTALMLVLFIALLSYYPAVAQAAHEHDGLMRSIPWVPALGMHFGFYLDGLALLFALIVTGVGAGVMAYCGQYFDDAEEQGRFVAILAAFAGSMLGLVLSNNLLTLFVMWEGTSLTSFLLIGYKGRKSEAARLGALQALLITGGGALALIIGLVMLGFAAGSTLNPDANGLPFTAEITRILSAGDLSEHPWYALMTLCIMIGAFTKSAQFPFHFWLPGSMEAPTPASAYLHSATMVKAGIYLLARLYPPLHDSALWLNGLVIVGLLTFVLGAFWSISQRDLKGMLAYTTISMLGALVALIGLPDESGFEALALGILAHALYKAALFLIVGTIDHSYNTRHIDQLGGLADKRPITAAVALVSALSMAGLIPLFGFVAKEALIHAFFASAWGWAGALTIVLGSIFMGMAGYILIWDVFFRKPPHPLHEHHHLSPWIDLTPVMLALGTVSLGFLLEPIINPLMGAVLGEEVHLHLIPEWGPEFAMSLTAIGVGVLLFLLRGWLLRWPLDFLPKGAALFKAGLGWLDDMSAVLLRAQSGQIRYYLIVILGTVALVLLGSNLLDDLLSGNPVQLTPQSLDELIATLLDLMLVILAVGGALLAVLQRRHVVAALSMGVTGYAVGGIFLLEHAPDVALVQFLVETLATVLIVIMIGRIAHVQRWKAMQQVFSGAMGRWGLIRDVFIATVVGGAVFIFALTAILNRPDRESISTYHLQNTEEQLGLEDVVGAIVADYRGMDTWLEITVFAAAALGVLSLLRGGRETRPERRGISRLIPAEDVMREDDDHPHAHIRDATSLSTPFTRMVATIILPVALLVGLSHIFFGGSGPGDGFTAGAMAGLGIAMWYVIFGFFRASERLAWFPPGRALIVGLTLALLNAVLPLLLGDLVAHPELLAHNEYGALLGLDAFLALGGLKFNSGLIFEISIALTVAGGIGLIMEAIAYPQGGRDAIEKGQ